MNKLFYKLIFSWLFSRAFFFIYNHNVHVGHCTYLQVNKDQNSLQRCKKVCLKLTFTRTWDTPSPTLHCCTTKICAGTFQADDNKNTHAQTPKRCQSTLLSLTLQKCQVCGFTPSECHCSLPWSVIDLSVSVDTIEDTAGVSIDTTLVCARNQYFWYNFETLKRCLMTLLFFIGYSVWALQQLIFSTTACQENKYTWKVSFYTPIFFQCRPRC